eukprot:jgi/Mesvir1/2550/Mv00985-RA.1
MTDAGWIPVLLAPPSLAERVKAEAALAGLLDPHRRTGKVFGAAPCTTQTRPPATLFTGELFGLPSVTEMDASHTPTQMDSSKRLSSPASQACGRGLSSAWQTLTLIEESSCNAQAQSLSNTAPASQIPTRKETDAAQRSHAQRSHDAPCETGTSEPSQTGTSEPSQTGTPEPCQEGTTEPLFRMGNPAPLACAHERGQSPARTCDRPAYGAVAIPLVIASDTARERACQLAASFASEGGCRRAAAGTQQTNGGRETKQSSGVSTTSGTNSVSEARSTDGVSEARSHDGVSDSSTINNVSEARCTDGASGISGMDSARSTGAEQDGTGKPGDQASTKVSHSKPCTEAPPLAEPCTGDVGFRTCCTLLGVRGQRGDGEACESGDGEEGARVCPAVESEEESPAGVRFVPSPEDAPAGVRFDWVASSVCPHRAPKRSQREQQRVAAAGGKPLPSSQHPAKSPMPAAGARKGPQAKHQHHGIGGQHFQNPTPMETELYCEAVGSEFFPGSRAGGIGGSKASGGGGSDDVGGGGGGSGGGEARPATVSFASRLVAPAAAPAPATASGLAASTVASPPATARGQRAAVSAPTRALASGLMAPALSGSPSAVLGAAVAVADANPYAERAKAMMNHRRRYEGVGGEGAHPQGNGLEAGEGDLPQVHGLEEEDGMEEGLGVSQRLPPGGGPRHVPCWSNYSWQAGQRQVPEGPSPPRAALRETPRLSNNRHACPRQVPRVSNITRESFREIFLRGQPVVLSGLDLGPCVARWRDLDYLVEAVGTDRVVRVHVCAVGQVASFGGIGARVVDLAGHRPANTPKNFAFVDMGFGEFVARCVAAARAVPCGGAHQERKGEGGQDKGERVRDGDAGRGSGEGASGERCAGGGRKVHRA